MTIIGRQISRLSGYAAALPTPFDAGGHVDRDAFAHLCDLQIEAGATALVVCGTTGEAPTLSPAEHGMLIQIAVAVARGRVPVIAGAGSNSTTHAIELSKDAEIAGADALLSVVPYYNKPTQSGLYAHFSAIAQSTGLPLFLYDVPARSACRLADETVARLAELPQIIGLKDATGDVSRPLRLRPLTGHEFRLMAGDDATSLAFISQGGNGCISVTSNVAPGLCRKMFRALRQGQTDTAQRWATELEPLTESLFCESNPAPLKHALSLLGLIAPRLRLPLVEVSDTNAAAIAAALARVFERHADGLIGSLSAPLQAARCTAR